MPITYLPSELFKRKLAERQLARLLTQSFSVNRSALSVVSSTDLVPKEKILDTALKVAKEYRKRFISEKEERLDAGEARKVTLNGKKKLVQRVKSLFVYEVAQSIRDLYFGKKFEWLPSSAEEPDPLHQLNYGKIFKIRFGQELPGDRFGCQCGMRIIVPENELSL